MRRCSKGLFLSLPLHGHVNPSLPLVRALVDRGDQIAYYAGDQFAAAVEQTGARYRRYGHANLANAEQLFARTDSVSWELMRAASNVLAADLDNFRAERPDYVIADSVAPWGQWAGQILKVPVVTSVSTFAFNRHVLKFSVRHGVRPTSAKDSISKIRHMTKAFLLARQLRREHRVKGPGVVRSVLGQSDLNIVYTSRYFQPCAETFDARFHFVGPSVGRRSATTGFPWDRLSHPVVVYVSLGTVFNTDAAFFRNCFEAFAGQDLQVIVSTGASVAPDSLGPAPPNFIVQPFVPQLEVLQRVSAFVTHGGMNSVSESLYYGVPVVVIPQMSEQAIVGRRAEDLGAGLYLAKERAGPEPLREAVARVLADDRFRAGAAAVRKSFDDAGGVAGGADAIFAFTSVMRNVPC